MLCWRVFVSLRWRADAPQQPVSRRTSAHDDAVVPVCNPETAIVSYIDPRGFPKLARYSARSNNVTLPHDALAINGAHHLVHPVRDVQDALVIEYED